jgi:hypothetical protein
MNCLSSIEAVVNGQVVKNMSVPTESVVINYRDSSSTDITIDGKTKRR